mmetsp:Transcript_23857/g.62884  ORF Transcript_23857/g.62884 Transcript_23857/m.62884 type:complete len:451 (-) Transcript_23857:75-1427(-)
MLGATLQGVLNILELAARDGKERHVADSEATVLDDLHAFAVRASGDRPELPGVTEVAHRVRGLEHVQHDAAGRWHRTLVHEPARHAWAREVLPPRHDVDLVGAVFNACSRVLDSECAITQDSHISLAEVIIRRVVAHAVAYVALEDVLARVVDDPVLRQAARVAVYAGDGHLGGRSAVLTDRVHGQAVVAVMPICVTDDLDLGDVRFELAVREDAVLLCRMLEVLEDLGFPGPCLPILGWVRTLLLHILLSPPHVEGTHLGLQPGSLVGGGDPAIATNPIVTIEDHNVVARPLDVRHCRFEAMVPGTDDPNRVRPLVRRRLEALDAPDGHLAPHLICHAQLARAAATLHQEDQAVHVNHESASERLLDVPDLRAGLHGEGDLLVGAEDLQLDLAEALAEDPARPLHLGVEDVQPHGDHAGPLLGGSLVAIVEFRGWRRTSQSGAHRSSFP